MLLCELSAQQLNWRRSSRKWHLRNEPVAELELAARDASVEAGNFDAASLSCLFCNWNGARRRSTQIARVRCACLQHTAAVTAFKLPPPALRVLLSPAVSARHCDACFKFIKEACNGEGRLQRQQHPVIKSLHGQTDDDLGAKPRKNCEERSRTCCFQLPSVQVELVVCNWLTRTHQFIYHRSRPRYRYASSLHFLLAAKNERSRAPPSQ